MIDESLMVERIGKPETAGDTREGQKIELIVVDDTAAAGYSFAARIGEGQDSIEDTVPNYWIDSDGATRQFVADDRAGNGLEIAIYNKRRRNIDRVAISILLERREGEDYSNVQLRSLHGLLDQVMNRHGLEDSALATVMPDSEGRKRVYPYVPPPPPIEEEATGDLLGGGATPDQELWAALWGETYLPRTGAGANLGQAFPRFAAKMKLGAPVGPNDKTTTVVFEGGTYSVQPFATDLIFYQGTDYGGVRSLNDLYDDDAAEIPAKGLARALLEKSYTISITKTEQILGAPFKSSPASKTLQPGWRFHLVAKNGRLGPAISANYLFNADQAYAFQVFAADTLYTPNASEPAGCYYLNRTEPTHPAFNALWAETYKATKVAFDPNSDFHKKAVELRIGIPLSGVYSKNLGGTNYQIQVWSLDTLYKGPDGQIKRMTDLPTTTEVATWSPSPPKPVPPTPPNPLPPAMPPTNAGAPKPNDINWPPRPNFPFLTDKNGAREKALGRIEWVRANGDNIRITNEFANNIITITVPQLAKIKGGGNGQIKFHRVAADQMIKLWAAWEAAGLLHFVLNFAGTFVPRTIRNNPRVLSNHAYGTAFDINVEWNGLMKVAALVGQKGSVRELVPLANAHGFYWGGHWNYDGKGASDGMHFEWARPA